MTIVAVSLQMYVRLVVKVGIKLKESGSNVVQNSSPSDGPSFKLGVEGTRVNVHVQARSRSSEPR